METLTSYSHQIREGDFFCISLPCNSHKRTWHESKQPLSNLNEQITVTAFGCANSRQSVFHTSFRATCGPNRNQAHLRRGATPIFVSPVQEVYHGSFQIQLILILVLSAHARSYSARLRRVILSVTRWSSSAVHKWGRTGDRVKDQARGVLFGRVRGSLRTSVSLLQLRALLLPQSTPP